MRKLKVTFFLISFFFFNSLFAQNVLLEGYVYETGNRGFLNLVSVKVFDTANRLVTSAASDRSGVFNLELPLNQDLIIIASKDIFKEKKLALSTKNRMPGEKLYLKVEMNRQPGYLFDVTLAARRTKDQIKNGLPSDAITGARIEMYNNTKEKQVLDIKDNPFPNFKVHFEDGNHYTIMIRKQNFFTKRMEAYVNVEGCILCFDGVGEVKPGVSDVMTEENTMGTLLANVELRPVEIGEAIKVENIYYDKNSAKIREDAAEELDKLIILLKDNPKLLIELSSHTDSRGDDKFNKRLSQKRADAAVEYILDNTGIDPFRIKAKGYGESKLVNKCRDGIECSEARHQKNRRTEFKVTGMLAEDPINKLSLAQIIEKEKMDKLMEEILNQEIVEVKAGEELPEEIRKQIEGKNNPESSKEHKELPEKPEPEIIEQAQVVSVKPSQEAAAETEFADHRSDAGKLEEKPNNSEMNTSYLSKKPVIRSPVNKSYSEGQKQTAGEYSTNRIVDELKVDVNYKPVSAKKMTSDYSGYMVEFFSSRTELPISHEIFSRHGNIYKEMKKDGTYAYMFGPFAEWRDANRFLQTAVSERYKNSKVIRFKNGKRIEN